MNNQAVLLIAGPEGDDELLVDAVAAHRPLRVTVVIDADDPTWDWSEASSSVAHRERLAYLLTAIARRTGAAVVGLVGDPIDLRLGRFDAVVGANTLRAAA